jgi:elongation factor P
MRRVRQTLSRQARRAGLFASMTISSLKEIKKGTVLIYQDEPCLVLEANFLRMQANKPVMQTKMRGLKTGNTYKNNFKEGDGTKTAELTRKSANYLYHDGTNFVFMDNESYDQLTLAKDSLGDKANYLVDNLKVDLLYWQDELVSLDIPIKVDLKVTETEPGVRGDTAQGSVNKPATLETGLTIQVPIFVKQGDTVRVNTEKGEYVERVN